MKRSLIINAPWYYPQAHKTLLSLLTHKSYQGLFDKAIFMGSAAPLGALKPSKLLESYLTNSSISYDQDLLDSCASCYRRWAQEQNINLLVCGMAAKRYYQDPKLSSCDGIELTGYMEVLMLINSSKDKLVIW